MLIAIRNTSAALGLAALAAGCGGVSQEKYNAAVSEADKYKQDAATQSQRVTDYIAGMTDRFCIAKFTELTIPEEARF